jgi:hypothetical protein
MPLRRSAKLHNQCAYAGNRKKLQGGGGPYLIVYAYLIQFYTKSNQKKLWEKIALTLLLTFASFKKVGLVSYRVGAGAASKILHGAGAASKILHGAGAASKWCGSATLCFNHSTSNYV